MRDLRGGHLNSICLGAWKEPWSLFENLTWRPITAGNCWKASELMPLEETWRLEPDRHSGHSGVEPGGWAFYGAVFVACGIMRVFAGALGHRRAWRGA